MVGAARNERLYFEGLCMVTCRDCLGRRRSFSCREDSVPWSELFCRVFDESEFWRLKMLKSVLPSARPPARLSFQTRRLRLAPDVHSRNKIRRRGCQLSSATRRGWWGGTTRILTSPSFRRMSVRKRGAVLFLFICLFDCFPASPLISWVPHPAPQAWTVHMLPC